MLCNSALTRILISFPTCRYFSAPSSFLGDKCFAYNGIFSFRLGHSEYMSNGKDMILDWDVILESKVREYAITSVLSNFICNSYFQC